MHKLFKNVVWAMFSLSLFIVGCQSYKQELSLPTVFSDNMVLQQNENVNFWGKAKENTKVVVEASWGEIAETTSNSQGEWKIQIPTIKAGGPYSVKVKNVDSEIAINNVMLGEVWLASGQSNMEMSMAGWPPTDLIETAEEVIANSANENIRMFTVTKSTSIVPMDNVDGAWQVASPETTGSFSATAYFFAKKIYEEINVPIGIIHSSWGGTPIESWISAEKISTDTDYPEITAKLKEQQKQQDVYNNWLTTLKNEKVQASHENQHPFKGLDVFDSYFTDENLDFSNWETIQLPNMIENSAIGDFDGVVWFKKEIVIPNSWEGKNIEISLGAIDDMDVTYLNGKVVGATEEEGFWQVKRYYNVDANDFETGKAVITIKMIDAQGGGGFSGSANDLAIYVEGNESEKISLAGEWKYNVAAELVGATMYYFNPENDDYKSRPKLEISLNSSTPTVLYNAMIAPIVPYNLKGIIWYQGEANVGRANQYVRLTSLLVNDWRERFNNPEASFYYVQLAPWHYNDINGISSANLRDAQRRALEIENTGMAVTLDVGNNENIHPAKKAEVGERLAFWALKDKYEKDIPFSGPLFIEKEVSGNKITLRFVSNNGGLVIKKNVPNQFEIAGENNVFYPAQVKIVDDSKIEVSSSKVSKPVNVRYAYKNGSVASFFNGVGLPSPSFTTEEEIEN